MNIRRTNHEDLSDVMNIYSLARDFMRNTGNPNQWNQNYPSLELIQSDIHSDISYIVLDDQENIIGVFMYSTDIDPTYLEIEGLWLNDEPYGVIHRIASKPEVKGVGSYVFDWALQQCDNLRIDTHHENTVMRNLLKKEGFEECGIIYLVNGEPRIAYQKYRSQT